MNGESQNKIRNDLVEVQELSTISKDPLGYAVYLYFLLKNKRNGVEVDNLIDWMNSWVENILIKRNFSRFIDREVVSSFFAHFSLKAFGQLHANVGVEDFKQLFSEYIEDGHFFCDFTFSSLIALSIADFKDEIKEYSDLLTWIETQIEEKNIFNDAKNLVFASILFEKLGSKDHIKKIFDYCHEKLLKNNIVSYDQLYYSYVLWKFRSQRDKKEDLQKIREFTDESLENANEVMLREEEKFIEEIYGANAQKATSKIGASKIYLGVLIDLLNDFGKSTIKVSKDELARKDISLWISLGPLFSTLVFFFSIAVIWFSFQLRALVDFSVFTKDQTLITLASSVINVFLFALTAFLFVASISLFWDTGIKRIGTTKLMKDNLKARLKKYVWVQIVALLLGLLKILLAI